MIHQRPEDVVDMFSKSMEPLGREWSPSPPDVLHHRVNLPKGVIMADWLIVIGKMIILILPT